MTETCYPLPPAIAHDMLQTAARAMCDRPGENAAQRDSRTQQMVHQALGIGPRDGLEYMLSILTVGHFSLILDSILGVFQGQEDATKARGKSTIVALDRSFLGFVRESHVSLKRPLANTAVETKAVAPEAARPPVTNPASSPIAVTPAQSHGVERAPPGPATGLLGKGSAAYIPPVQTRPLGAPASAKPPPLPAMPIAPSQPPKNILQTGPDDQFLAEFEKALAEEAAQARKKENAGRVG